MFAGRRSLAAALTFILLLGLVPAGLASAKSEKPVRFATFNASLNRGAAGQALADLSNPNNAQANAVAEIIQRIRPDVLLINEFDYYAPTPEHPEGPLVEAFRDNYLALPHNGAAPIEYPHTFVAESNTGITSGFDLNNANGYVSTVGAFGYGDDSFGFGAFPGQFGMAVYSRFPISTKDIRTFQHFLWKDMPGAKLPDDPTTPGVTADWYTPAELAVFRLSSKSHWDVPIKIRGTTVHFLVSHPTPPVFDSVEDRNGTRNFDEIRLWADYITPGSASDYIYDDDGVHGGLAAGALFVIAGDQNSDPLDGDSIDGAIQQLIEHPLVNVSFTPSSAGGPEAAVLQGGANATHLSNPAFDTADFADGAPGNLRADYVLPRENMTIRDGAVFWPVQADRLLFPLTGVFPFPSSDHRAVWLDLVVPR
jgi:Endonuclease/Exonuclease/phosphatase family